MVAELDMLERDTQVEGMTNPHQATLNYIESVLAELRAQLVASQAFPPHECESIIAVLRDEWTQFGELDRKRVAVGLHAKQFGRARAAALAGALVP